MPGVFESPWEGTLRLQAIIELVFILATPKENTNEGLFSESLF